jgi:hypothetical protein
MTIRVVPETSEEFYKNKNFMKNCSTKNMDEKYVTGLTDTPITKTKKSIWFITFTFHANDKITFPFYGTYRQAEKESESLGKVYNNDVGYTVSITDQAPR